MNTVIQKQGFARAEAARVVQAKADRETDPVLKNILGAMAGAMAGGKSDEEAALDDAVGEIAAAVAREILNAFRVEFRDYAGSPGADDLADHIKGVIRHNLKDADLRHPEDRT